MKKIFAISMLASLMLFGCKSEEPKQATESSTKTIESSTTTAPEGTAKTTETKVMEKTTETQTAPAEAQK